MKSLTLIGISLLLIVVGVTFRVNADPWSRTPMPGQSSQPGSAAVLVIDTYPQSIFTDAGDAMCLMGLIAFTLGTYGWLTSGRAAR